MKVSIDIDCTPDEARRFLGLPDVAPMQERMLAEVEKRMKAGLQAMDPEQMMKTWLPLGLQGLEEMQRFFWSQMSGGKSGGKKGGG